MAAAVAVRVSTVGGPPQARIERRKPARTRVWCVLVFVFLVFVGMSCLFLVFVALLRCSCRGLVGMSAASSAVPVFAVRGPFETGGLGHLPLAIGDSAHLPQKPSGSQPSHHQDPPLTKSRQKPPAPDPPTHRSPQTESHRNVTETVTVSR